MNCCVSTSRTKVISPLKVLLGDMCLLQLYGIFGRVVMLNVLTIFKFNVNYLLDRIQKFAIDFMESTKEMLAVW